MTTLIIALAILIGVPSFIAGWLACGFRDLRLTRGRRGGVDSTAEAR